VGLAGRWQGIESSIRLQGWSRDRRVIVLRRKVGAPPQSFEDLEPGNEQMALPGLEWQDRQGERYEHAVLVTSWAERDVLAVAQMYRDRADSENMFDRLKNQ
jgi:hypothetical protein